MGVGWLACEGKLVFLQERGVLKVAIYPVR
jgi:hypothetical protein